MKIRPDPFATTASGWFGAMVADYDSLIRRCVPRYDEMIERLGAYLPPRADRILELGCGTGNLTLALARRYPDAALTLVDASPEMAALTHQRLAQASPAHAARLATRVERFEDLGTPRASFDLVTSCIALHHVEDKARLFARVHETLAPGGSLVFADQLRGATDAIHALNWEAWLAFCREPGHCDEDELRGLIDHAQAHDHYVPLAEHFALLADAGFVELDCVWRHWIWTIVVARRPEE